MNIGTEKFYLKVGETILSKGAEFGLRPDGLVTNSDAERINAKRILSENVGEKHKKHRRVFHSTLGELLACANQIDEFRHIRQQFIQQRITEGATAHQAFEESKEISRENIQKAQNLRAERAERKAKVLDKIEAKLPKAADPEVRAKLIQAYLNDHKAEIIAESERYTLGEIKAEVELKGSVKGEKAKSFLASYAEAEMDSEDFERNAEAGIRQVYSGIAEGFNRVMIPGYSAWADGGTTTEVISSAGSDLVLTLVGGKVVKVAWTGTKALYNSAKTLGKTLVGGKQVAIENRLFLEQPKMIRHHLFNRFWQQSESSQKYREFFRKHGIKVDDFCVELPRTTHVNTIHQRQNDWTNRWKIWIDSNPDATTKEVFQFAGRLMDEYGISHVPIVKYRK